MREGNRDWLLTREIIFWPSMWLYEAKWEGLWKTSLLPLWHLLKGPHFLAERTWLQPQETYSPRTLKRGGECSGITGLSSSFHQLAAPFPLSFCPVLDSNSSPSAPRLTNTEDTKMIHPAPALSPMPSQPSASIMAIVLTEVMMHSMRLSLYWKYCLRVRVTECIHLHFWPRGYMNLSF